MKRYERLSLTKKRKISESDKQTAAVTLLALPEDGNGTLYCETHLDAIAWCMDLEKQNKYDQKQYPGLEDECQRLVTENATLKKDVGNMTEDCTDLSEASRKLTEYSNKQSLTKQSFMNDDSKVKYYILVLRTLRTGSVLVSQQCRGISIGG